MTREFGKKCNKIKSKVADIQEAVVAESGWNDATRQRGEALRYLHALLQAVDHTGIRQSEWPMVSALRPGARLHDLSRLAE